MSPIHDERVPGLALFLCEQFNEAGQALESIFVDACSKLQRRFVRYILN
jgi:hypothetical protein